METNPPSCANPSIHSDELMLPELMVELPMDLACEWLFVPVPVGQRCLVISARGMTQSFLPDGTQLHKWSSALPAGGRGNKSSPESYCLLDCVYNSTLQAYFVIDLMVWRGFLAYECSTDFRFFCKQLPSVSAAAASSSSSSPFALF